MAEFQANQVGTISMAVKELLPNYVEKYSGEVSPAFNDMVGTNEGVRQSEWGRDWLIRKTFRTGLAGAFEFTGIPGTNAINTSTDTDITGTTNDPLFQIYGRGTSDANLAAWPGMNNSTSPGYFIYAVPLMKGKGNLFIPLEVIEAAEQGAAIADQVDATLEMTAKNVLFNRANAFWAETDTLAGLTTTTKIATFPGCVLGWFYQPASGLVDMANNASVTVTLQGGSIARFGEGLRVDLITVNGAASDDLVMLNETTSPAFINVVDGYANQVQIVNVSGAAWNNATVPTSPTVVKVLIVAHKSVTHNVDSGGTTLAWAAGGTITLPAGASTMRTTLPHGIERILASSGTLYGHPTGTNVNNGDGIDLGRFKWAQSYVPAAVNAALDEFLIHRYMARMVHGRGSRSMRPDTLWVSEGVFAACAEAQGGTFEYERQGRKLDLSQLGVASEIMFNGFGTTYRMKADSFVGSGKAYGVVTRNKNWKIYSPPKLRNTQTGAEFDQSIEFVGKFLGYNGSMFGVNNTSGQPVDAVQAPFNLRYQICPDYIPGVKLSGITEAYGPTA